VATWSHGPKAHQRPRDIFELSNLIGDIATGQVREGVADGKDPSAVSLGKRGDLKGGRRPALNPADAARVQPVGVTMRD
jgi:hypothetical protein